jgi:[protein-PII] uridylyltransferase
MPSLLEKIEADATERLPLPPGRELSKELARYKNFLKVESHRLKLLHRAGGSGLEICRARAHVLDVLLRHLLQAIQTSPLLAHVKGLPAFALVATGGYGRGELNPFSDIDIMFLHDGALLARGKTHPLLTALTGEGGFVYALFDIGLKVGHSSRSVEDCVRLANHDMQSKTSLIEARLIEGRADLFRKLQETVLTKCVNGYEDEYIAARVADQNTRRAKFGNSACMQEPNLKNGCGGLRDYQNLFWMAFCKYKTRSWEELRQRDLISDSEQRHLEAAYTFLLRVRNELHYHHGRAVDVLAKSVQPTIANSLGYHDRSPSKRLEHFMRDLYTHTRNIDLITRTIEQRLALLPQPKRLPSFRALLLPKRAPESQIIDGFKITKGEIHVTSPRVFRDQPRRLMRLFLHAQQRGLKLHPDLVQLVRNQASLVDNDFLRDQHVHDTFLEILNQRGNVASILRVMHDVGFLGKYLPEFGRLTCLVQHEFYHQYTADEHTLMCIAKLDETWAAKRPPLSHYAEIFQTVERPFVLYLALLLHDAGKAQPEAGDHSEVGALLAARVARRLGLDTATTEALQLLIRHHLLMSVVSQRRDLDDPAVIRHFAGQVQNVENLALLTLHTLADSLGTSEHFWNGFKDTSLWTLFHKTRNLLAGGTDFLRKEEMQRGLLELEVRRLAPSHVSDEEVHAHFLNLPPRYLVIHSAKQIVADLQLVHRFLQLQLPLDDHALEPVIHWHNEPDRGYTAVHICTWDRAGLFSKICGSFSAAGLNILSAQIFSRTDGIILDTFFVTDARTGTLAKKEEREQFEALLTRTLTGEAVDLASLIAKQKSRLSPYQHLEGEGIPTVIHFDNATSDTRTIIDIQTEDRVGLLYAISQALAELRVDISVAKICTEKGAAFDSFYVTDLLGGKLRDEGPLKHIEERLRAAVKNLR